MSVVVNNRFERPAPELVARFRRLATSTVGNVLDEYGIDGIMLDIKPVRFGMRFAGPAYTAREVSGSRDTFTGAEFGLGAVIDTALNGDVIVIDNGGQKISTWGGIASLAAQMKGVAGLVVDGGLRDADEIASFEFPAFSRHVVPLSGKTRVKVLETGVTVKIDSVKVRPGDIIVADSTGVVCVPLDIATQVADRAEQLDADDQRAIEAIRGGLDFSTALTRFPKL